VYSMVVKPLDILHEEPLHDVVRKQDAQRRRHQGDQGPVHDAVHVT
jgi:hypothetical protein